MYGCIIVKLIHDDEERRLQEAIQNPALHCYVDPLNGAMMCDRTMGPNACAGSTANVDHHKILDICALADDHIIILGTDNGVRPN